MILAMKNEKDQVKETTLENLQGFLIYCKDQQTFSLKGPIAIILGYRTCNLCCEYLPLSLCENSHR